MDSTSPPERNPPDQQVFDMLRDGNPAAFTAILARYGNRLLHFTMRYGFDAAGAEDILQDALVRAFQQQDSLRHAASLQAWLFSIVRHRCLNELRAARRRPAMTPITPDLPVRGATETTDTLRALRATVAQLDEADRELLHLRFYQELAYADIAAIYGLTPDAIRQRYHRLLKDLQKHFHALR